MKLNIECVRDVMLSLEELLTLTETESGIEKNSVSLHEVCSSLPQYSHTDVFYSIKNLDEAGYINASIKWINATVNFCYVNYITYQGHEFISRIADSTQWSKVQKVSNAVRDYSLSAISSIAEGVTSAAIAAYLSKNPPHL